MAKDQIKKHQQIFELKEILSNSIKESLSIKTKLIELNNIFKKTKKIIKEKISLIEKSKSEINDININEIKNQICIELKEIIRKYQNNISINNKKEEYKKKIEEKNAQLKILLNKLKYNDLKNEKDLLIQEIQQKKNICENFDLFIKYEKDIFYLLHPKNINYLEDLYFVNINLQKDKKYKDLINNKKEYIKGNKKFYENRAKEVLFNLKNDLKNEKEELNKYIYEKGFNYKFQNNKNKEKYYFEIDLIEKENYSSDSDSNIDSDYDNQKSFFKDESSIKKGNIQEQTSNNLKNYLKNKKISISSSNKDTNDQDRDINNNNNINLVNKLAKLKEKYNKLSSEKFELENKKKLKEKKINEILKMINMN